MFVANRIADTIAITTIKLLLVTSDDELQRSSLQMEQESYFDGCILSVRSQSLKFEISLSHLPTRKKFNQKLQFFHQAL